jgi:hypothetical protein
MDRTQKVKKEEKQFENTKKGNQEGEKNNIIFYIYIYMYRFYNSSKSDDSEDDSPPNVVPPPSTVVPPPSNVPPRPSPRPPPPPPPPPSNVVPLVSKIKLEKDNPSLYRSLCKRLLSAIHKNDIIEVKEAILQGADPNCTGELPAFIYGLSMYEINNISEDYPLLAATEEYYNKPFVIPPPAPPPLEDFDTKLIRELQPLLDKGMDYEDAFRIAEDIVRKHFENEVMQEFERLLNEGTNYEDAFRIAQDNIVRKRHPPPPVPHDRFSITYLPRNPEDYEYKKRFEIIKILIDAGADVNCTNQKFSVLEYIRGMNDSNVIKLLLENEADVNYVNSFGGALLHTHINNVEVVNLLLSKGANINVKNQRGETPLFLAADYKYIEVVKLLLDKGVDINQVSHDGQTAYQVATPKIKAIIMEHEKQKWNRLHEQNRLPELDYRDKEISDEYNKIKVSGVNQLLKNKFIYMHDNDEFDFSQALLEQFNGEGKKRRKTVRKHKKRKSRRGRKSRK